MVSTATWEPIASSVETITWPRYGRRKPNRRRTVIPRRLSAERSGARRCSARSSLVAELVQQHGEGDALELGHHVQPCQHEHTNHHDAEAELGSDASPLAGVDPHNDPFVVLRCTPGRARPAS